MQLNCRSKSFRKFSSHNCIYYNLTSSGGDIGESHPGLYCLYYLPTVVPNSFIRDSVTTDSAILPTKLFHLSVIYRQ